MGNLAKKRFLSLFFILINVGVIAWIALHEFQGSSGLRFRDIIQVWIQNWVFFLLAIACAGLALLSEGLKYFFLIKRATGQSRLYLALKTAIVGKYYDNITPLGSGGQAFQIYTLYKGGIPSGVASSLPISGFSMMQIAFFILGLGFFLFNGDVISDPVFRILAYVGLGFMIFLPFMVVLFILLPKVSTATVFFIAKILKKLHLVKVEHRFARRILRSLNDFKVSLGELMTSKLTVFITLLLSLLYQVALCSIPYFVILASGFQANYLDTLTLTLFVYSAIAFIPTPGNAGAAEISFTLIFTAIPAQAMFWSMMLWRFASYYLFILVGFTGMLIAQIRGIQDTFPRIKTLPPREEVE